MTYANAPISNGKTAPHSEFEFSTTALQFFHKKGVPKEKLCIGIPFYGRTFTLKDPNQHGIGATITGAGKPWKSHGQGGTALFWEICLAVKKEGWKKEQGNNGHDPYAYNGNQWVGYDDTNQAYQ